MLDQFLLTWGRVLSVLAAYWYIALPALLGVLTLAVLRLKLWPRGRHDYLRGLAVEVSEQHDLIVLIHAARVDPSFRADVMQLLDLAPDERRKFLELRIQGMAAAGAPTSFIEAIGLLRDERVVIRVRHLLEQAARDEAE